MSKEPDKKNPGNPGRNPGTAGINVETVWGIQTRSQILP